MVRRKTWALVACTALLAACNTVTIRPGGGTALTSAPTHEQKNDFFFWGLAGTAHVDAKGMCGRRGVTQMQTQTSFVDGLLGALTIGIYSPQHSRVWCQ